MKNAVGQNARPQTASTPQKFLRAGRNRPIHPVTGPAFLGPAKPNPLNFKIFSDQNVEIDIACKNISPQTTWTNALDLQRAA